MTNFVLRACASLVVLPFLTPASHADDCDVVEQAKKRLAGLYTVIDMESVVAFDELRVRRPGKPRRNSSGTFPKWSPSSRTPPARPTRPFGTSAD